MKNIKNILFVCTGNSCRSIMAEGYLRHRAEEKGLDLEVRSAGTLGLPGLSPAKESLQALTSAGVSVETLRSKALTPDLVEWADLILVMEPMHKLKVGEILPEAASRTFYLGEFNPERGDMVIPDPIGRPYSFYRVSFRLIRQCIEGMLKWLEQ
ncbi:MAG: low molecular weight protein arginine phosphatase [Candidatus Omnitrophica bacterium]|nr:low molecular weight protein arginine phosphatase [Candidatus Omnitrophota bacterium]